jgi:hypothetical protein
LQSRNGCVGEADAARDLMRAVIRCEAIVAESAVDLPAWLVEPALGYVTPLSRNADNFDDIPDGRHRNIGRWVDRAAQKAGRQLRRRYAVGDTLGID